MSDNLDNVDVSLTGGVNANSDKLNSTKRIVKLKTVLKVSFCLNILLLVSLVVVYFVQQHKRLLSEQSHNHKIPGTKLLKEFSTEHSDVFCVPCEELGDDVIARDTTYDIITTTTCNKKVCCNFKHQELQKLILQSLSDSRYSRDEIPEGLEWWFKRRYSAHLSRDRSSNDLTWTNHTTDELTFINDLRLQENNITIPTRDATGMYFVYSVITQKVENARKLPISYHQIIKSNPSVTFNGQVRETIVIMGKYGGAAEKRDTRTSFLCSLISLQRGEQIAVRVGSGLNDQDFIVSGRLSNYFGMFRL